MEKNNEQTVSVVSAIAGARTDSVGVVKSKLDDAVDWGGNGLVRGYWDSEPDQGRSE